MYSQKTKTKLGNMYLKEKMYELSSDDRNKYLKITFPILIFSHKSAYKEFGNVWD